MVEAGTYHRDAPVTSYPLAPGWAPADTKVLNDALGRALAAFDGAEVDRVATYYDPDSNYAGALLTNIDETDPGRVDAADLFAVTTLSMRIHPKVARALTTQDSATRRAITRALTAIPTNVPITALDQGPGEPGSMLAALETMQMELRTARADHANAWVFASKMCARKRPHLAPVRDNVVCELLNGGPLKRGGIGTFTTDMQVFAYVMSCPETSARLRELHAEVTRRGQRPEVSDLRLLDVVMWTKGIGHWK